MRDNQREFDPYCPWSYLAGLADGPAIPVGFEIPRPHTPREPPGKGRGALVPDAQLSVRGSAFKILVAFILLTICGASPASGAGSPSWQFDAIERLKTIGVMPLWAGVVRPIPSAHLRAAVEEASRRSADRRLSPSDVALLERLRIAAGLTSLNLTTGPTRFTITRPSGLITGETAKSEWLIGYSANQINAAAVARLGGVGLMLGRSPTGWGPVDDGGLLFSDSAPGFDRIQAFVKWRNARFTKLVGLLDGNRSIVGTRLDIEVRANVRIGFGESIIMAGSPYWGYVLNPMPFLLSQYLEQQFRPLSGDNQLASADGEWVIRPGLRLFAELLVDDFTAPTPTANFPHRLGFTAGFHRAFETGADLRGLYTIVTNWTYTQEPGDYLLRGVPLGHPIGNDFDVLYLRWNRSQESSALWTSIIRKGEGRIGVAPSSDVEAREFWFLRGVIEYSVVGGADFRFSTISGWQGTIGPWIAYRSNAGHVPGNTRIDWGLTLVTGTTF